MKIQRTLVVVLAVLSIAVAGAAVTIQLKRLRRPATDFPDGTLWVCLDPACGVSASLSVAQLKAHYDAHEDEDPPCGKCGKAMARAIACRSCGKPVPRPDRARPDSAKPVCPHCGGTM